MKVIKLVVSVIDFDELGADGVKQTIENARYPNHCINPSVMSVEVRDIGEWSDDHPLNHSDKETEEFNRLFGPTNPPETNAELRGRPLLGDPA